MKLVLDTNVVIDWLVFDDPFLAAFREAVRDGRVRVFTQPHALDELRRVLAYRTLKLEASRQEHVIERYVTQTASLDAEADIQRERATLPQGFPRCRDPDDVPFLHLAWQARADALVSRDKAVLALKRRTKRFGFRVLDVPELMGEIGLHTRAVPVEG